MYYFIPYMLFYVLKTQLKKTPITHFATVAKDGIF